MAAEDCGAVTHDRKWQRLRLARPDGDEDGEKRRSLEIRHIRDFPGSRHTLRRRVDSRRRGGTPSTPGDPVRTDDVTRYSLPPILTPERHAVVRWKRAKWDHSLSVKKSRRKKRRQAAAAIVSFWQKRLRKIETSHSRIRTQAAKKDGDVAAYHPWSMVWTRSQLCDTCGQRVSGGHNMLGCVFCNQVAHRSCRIRDVEAHMAALCGEIIQQIDEDKGIQEVPETNDGGENWVCGHCLDVM